MRVRDVLQIAARANDLIAKGAIMDRRRPARHVELNGPVEGIDVPLAVTARALQHAAMLSELVHDHVFELGHAARSGSRTSSGVIGSPVSKS